MTSLELEQLAATIRDSPALAAKRDLALLTRLGAPLDGDDGAAIPHGDEYLIVCGEAIHPAFVRDNPHAAGAAAVVTNVSDVRAMGGRPVGLVDMLVSPDRAPRRGGARRDRVGRRTARGRRGRRASDARARARAVGVVHGRRPAASARRQRTARRRPPGGVLPRGPVHREHAVLQLAPRPRAREAPRRRRGARRGRPSPGPRTPPATCRCRASPDRCSSCSRSRAAARRSSSSGFPGPKGSRSSGGSRRSRASASCSWRLRAPPPSATEPFRRRGLACARCGRLDDSGVLRLGADGQPQRWDRVERYRSCGPDRRAAHPPRPRRIDMSW